MNYTKGVWKVTKHPPLDNYVVVLLGDKPYNDSGICQVDYLSDKEETLANANLIAAAPETAECLMESTKVLEDILRGYIGITPRGLIEQAVLNNKQTLAKAEGVK